MPRRERPDAKVSKELEYGAAWPMSYGPGNGEPLDRGQVVKLQGMPNDERLVRLGYLLEVEKGAERYQCAKCGKEFVGIGYRTAHGDLRHKNHPFDTPDDVDDRIEREYQIAAQTTPLKLDKTAASRR